MITFNLEIGIRHIRDVNFWDLVFFNQSLVFKIK